MRLLFLFAVTCCWYIALGQLIIELNGTSFTEFNKICRKCVCKNESKSIDCNYVSHSNIFDEKNWFDQRDIIYETLSAEFNAFHNLTLIPKINNIKNLILKNNQIGYIGHGIFENLKDLESLDLSYNNIREIGEVGYSPGFQAYVNLKTLNLGHNLLTYLGKNILQYMPNLTTLILEGNQFREITSVTIQGINSIPQLKFLDLSYMNLQSIPVTLFEHSKQLAALNLIGNTLKTVPHAIGLATNLKYLNLNRNPIRQLSGEYTFPKLENLKELYISEMPFLQTVDFDIFYSLPNVDRLWCTDNVELSTFIIDVSYGSITKVHLRNNQQLSYIQGPWFDLEFLDIRSNPVNCHCGAYDEIVKYSMNMLETAPYLRPQTTCGHPKKMMGTELATIFENKIQLCTSYPTTYSHPSPSMDPGTIITLSTLAGCVGFLLAVAAITIFCKKYRNKTDDDTPILPNYESIS